LVVTKDGYLVCRHENEIGGTTDVATKPEFASRKAVKIIDGERFEGWFTEDFTLGELKTLRCKERLPQLRPANMAHDGQDEIPTFDEVLTLIKGRKSPSGNPIGIYPETKHPSYFDQLNLSHDAPLVAAIKSAALDREDAAIFIQSFETGNLKRLNRQTKAPKIQLVSADGGPADRPELRYRDMIGESGLVEIARYAAGIGPQKSLIVPVDGAANAQAPTDLVARAHRANLKVHPWTFRAENFFLPAGLRRGAMSDPGFMAQAGDLARECQMFIELGVDGLFADHPGVAVEARNR
jgi:glycerophosphoryl diester phosphodiesterase